MSRKRQGAIRPDAQAFDEVRLFTVPRYKTSDLSGDEWRISAKGYLMRNGRVVHEFYSRNIENLTQILTAEMLRAQDEAKGYFVSEEDFCDQEGCSAQATVIYRVKEEFGQPHPREWRRPVDPPQHRQFCARHAQRGDAAFDDSDRNYELIEGTPNPSPEDESPAGAVVVGPTDE